MITSSTSFLSRFGHALERALDGESAQVVRPRGAQHTFGGLTDGRTDRTYDDCFSHVVLHRSLWSRLSMQPFGLPAFSRRAARKRSGSLKAAPLTEP